MKTFLSYLNEEAEDSKLKHIHHAEDRPLFHGADGFEHAHAALMHAHEHMRHGENNSDLTMKYDGSPSIVFGHHPETKKFFVATKSAFNKSPKINYTHADIEKNHGHAPGLVSKLKSALTHLPKVAPKHGVYQADLMHTPEDHKDSHLSEDTTKPVSFTPNTITYTAHGPEAAKVRKSKVGLVVHTQYHGNDITSMKASQHPDYESFKEHPDVHLKTAEHDTSKIKYPAHEQDKFKKHMDAAKNIHDTHGKEMYPATERHQGETGHLATYINHTVRHDEVPSASGLQKHITDKLTKAASKLKTQKSIDAKHAEIKDHVDHIEKNKSHYDNLLTMHHHLQQAKNTLVNSLETHEGGLSHHIDGKKSKPEGFVINHEHNGKVEPTKLVNRAEFAKANLLKVRK